MISILMPLYNGARFLRESANSVIAQTYTTWELIIGINGHSLNECNEIISIINDIHDNRTKIVLCDFKSKVKTLNKLAQYSKYNYLCMLDVDDCWGHQKLEKQLKFINKYDVVGTNFEYFGEKTGSPDLFLGKIKSKMFSYQNPIVNSAAMIKKSDAWWDESWEGLDDYNLWIHLLNKGKTFYNIPEVLTKHRIHSESYFNNKNKEMARALLDSKIKKMTEEEYVELGLIMGSKKWDL